MKEFTIDLDARYETVPLLARKLLNVPFKLYGRDPNIGIDCVGVTAIAATQAGFDCPNLLDSTPDASGKRLSMREAVNRDMMPISLSDVRPGDLLWFRLFWIQGDMGHLSIVSNTNPVTMIHTSPLTNDGPIEQRLTDMMVGGQYGFYQKTLGTWDRWLDCAYRFAKVNIESPEVEKVVLVSKTFGHKSFALRPAKNGIVELRSRS